MKNGKITMHFSSTDDADPRQLARAFGEALIAGTSQDAARPTAATPAQPPPLCVDCVHFGAYDGFRSSADCAAIIKFSPIYGNAPDTTPCGIQRSPGRPCGPAGLLFKPRPPTRWQRFKAWLHQPSEGPLWH